MPFPMWTSLFCYSVWFQHVSITTHWSSWMCRVLGFHCTVKSVSTVNVLVGWWIESGRTRDCKSCLLKPEHLFGLCSGELQGILESLHPSCYWHGLALRTREWMSAGGKHRDRGAGSLTDSRSWKSWQSGHLRSLPHRFSGFTVAGVTQPTRR